MDRLFIANRNYSSWSLRGWLLYEKFGLPKQVTLLDFADGPIREGLPDMAPARTVPAVKTAEGAVIWDSLALAEELATRHPEAQIWPSDPAARAMARSMAAEMHSSFFALREECTMNLAHAYQGFAPSPQVLDDAARMEELWHYARGRFGAEGPWLFGAYSAADAFFAPAASRFATYALPQSDVTRAYVATHLADTAFRQWRAMGLVSGSTLPHYEYAYDKAVWPGPSLRPSRPIAEGTPENDACPYSGKPITHLLEMEGRVFGFCNAFCRDKTVADPEAWPKFMALV